MSARPAIYATDVTVALGRRTVVDRCHLTVAPGDWVTLLGPNGAGKTTLLRALAGLVRAQGRIELHGRPLPALDLRQRARTVALVPQTPVVPESMTVAHYVLLGRTAHLGPLGRESARDRDVVDGALAQLELTGLAHRSVATLSGGERQRAVLARGVAQEASILLLDEPTSALDIARQRDTLEVVDGLRRRLGLTVVSTMHDLTLAAQFADHLVVMAAGAVVASGPPVAVLTGPELRRHYGTEVDVIRHRGELIVVPWRRRGGADLDDEGHDGEGHDGQGDPGHDRARAVGRHRHRSSPTEPAGTDGDPRTGPARRPTDPNAAAQPPAAERGWNDDRRT